MDWVIEKNTEEKAISLVLEFAVGKVQDIIQRMIQVYEPAILIVGTRGKSLGGIQGLLPGSVSKYCLQHSPVPVIVVRPSEKREKKRSKRHQKAATRGSYLDILERSGARGSHVLDRANRDSIVPEMSIASEQEAQAVAAAIGLPPVYEKLVGGNRISSSRRSSLRSDSELQEELQSPTAPDGSESPGVVMKSPTLGTLESEPPSDAELESSDDDDEDDEGRGRGSAAFEAVPGSLLHTHDVATDDEADVKKKGRAQLESGIVAKSQAVGDDDEGGGDGGGVKLDVE
ncbi:MAG: hypothetical protein M1824_000831 [Vezdaea acicularis]|nr:MAG: hypothetical protein M1824_000831 [Vezdaea acicularis]